MHSATSSVTIPNIFLRHNGVHCQHQTPTPRQQEIPLRNFAMVIVIVFVSRFQMKMVLVSYYEEHLAGNLRVYVIRCDCVSKRSVFSFIVLLYFC